MTYVHLNTRYFVADGKRAKEWLIINEGAYTTFQQRIVQASKIWSRQ